MRVLRERCWEIAALFAVTDVEERRRRKIVEYLITHDLIGNAEVRALFSVSAATANRILAGFSADGRLKKVRDGRRWAYRIGLADSSETGGREQDHT